MQRSLRRVDVEQMIEDEEPFLLRQRTPEELEDYDAGFRAGSKYRECDDDATIAWQRGWAEAQE
jgi:hypothetical protein